MSDRPTSDQLEHDVEAALARLATQAVPDSRRAPAPPWQEQRRSVDARRFGRATPWLVAAVLLVIAGLGVGAGVVFDASAPDRGPVATDPPSPTAVVTVSDGTLGDPTTPPTPTSTPSLDRGSNAVVPDDGVTTGAAGADLPYVAGIGTYGPVRVGMTLAEAQTALGLGPDDTTAGYGSTCKIAVPMPGQVPGGYTPKAIVDDAAGGTVVGFDIAAGTTDEFGNGDGTTLARLRASYPSGQLGYSVSGWTFSVFGTGDTGLGFNLATDSPQDQPPADSTVVNSLLPGTADYARGYELCVG